MKQLHTWSDPGAQHWSQRRRLGLQSQCLWTHCGLWEKWTRQARGRVQYTQKHSKLSITIIDNSLARFSPKKIAVYLSPVVRTFTTYWWLSSSLHTVVILDTEHKVTAWVTNSFHCDARELIHWCLGEQLPCRLEQKTDVRWILVCT